MRRSRLLIVLLLLLTACAAPSETGDTTDTAAVDVEVRPFTEIQDSEITFEGDPLDPSRGILRVTTTEASICAIVWGETTEFGRFNNSLSMNGTGIVQHDVALPDVEPGVEYSYVLQGTTADGQLFRSEVDTFTIEAAAETPEDADTVDRGPNLALDATVSDVSSEFGDSFAAELAIDGDLRTEWSSQQDGDGAFITLDLGEPTSIGAVAFITRSMADGTAITETFTVTTDDGTVLGPFPAGSPAVARVADVDVTARTLTFTVESSTGGNVGAVEVQVYG